MNLKEAMIILGQIRVAYPVYYKGTTKEDLTEAAKLWTRQFSDVSPRVVMAAVDSFIATDTKGFPPSIGIIKENMLKITEPKLLTEMEAWGLVKTALRRSGYHSQEEFNKLPPEVQKVVGSPRQLFDWSQADTDQVDTVIASNFQRSYRARAKNEREMLTLPSNVKTMIENYSERFKMIDDKKERNRLETREIQTTHHNTFTTHNEKE